MAGALELLQAERTGAWNEYLEATRGQEGGRYLEIEPWAWRRLEQRLTAIRARAKKQAAG